MAARCILLFDCSALRIRNKGYVFCSFVIRIETCRDREDCLSGDSKNVNTGAKAESHTTSSRTGTKVILVLVGLVAVAMFSFFLYKLWQKKKRDEQYARLLKLFEEDDELEVELGLRD
ncbi:hypothetical protein YC2023_097301 [Brassica napus]